jgi:hypothetical protein
VWVLPATPRTLKNFQWLALEIVEAGGDAVVWQAQLALPGRDQSLVAQFNMQVDSTYSELLGELDSTQADFADIGRRFQLANAQDYFTSELGMKVRQQLLTKESRRS